MTVQQHQVMADASVAPLMMSELRNRVAIRPRAAIDLDEGFSALITRLTITRHLDGVAINRNIRGRSLRGSKRAPVRHETVNRRLTSPSENVD